MRTPALKVLRDVWHHQARTLLVILAIAIGIVGAGSVLNTWSLLRRVTREGFLATNPASATLRVDAIDAELLRRVRAVPGIAEAAARRTTIGSALVGGTWRTAVLFSLDNPAAVSIGKLQREAGSWPPSDAAAVLERSSVEFAESGLGAPLTLRVGEGPELTLPVGGIARDAGLAPGWMEHVVYAFVTPGVLERLGAAASFNQLQLVARDPALDREAIRAMAFQVKAVAERAGHRVSDVEVAEPGAHIHAAQINSLLYTQGAFGVLALLLSAFLVVNLIAAMLAGQVREIGVMKACGAAVPQVGRMYLGLALALGLLACAVAIPIAALVGRWYAEFTASLLNFDTAGFAIPRWSLALQLGVGALLPVLAAAVPVRRGCRIPVSDALRDFGIAGSGSGAPGPLLRRVGGLSRPLLFSLRNAFRRRQRMVLTLLTLAMAGAVYLGALNLRLSITQSVGQLFGEINRFDVAVQFGRAYRTDSLETAIRAVNGVAQVETWGVERAAVQHSGGMLGNAFPLTGLPASSSMVAFPLRAGRWLQPGDSTGLVLGRRLLADEPGLSVGAEVTLILRGRPTRWRIVGVVESGVAPGAYVPRDALAARLGPEAAGAELAVLTTVARGPGAQGELSRRLRSELVAQGFAVRSSQLMAENRRVLEDHLLLVAGFLLIMAQATLVVGGLGLASTMSLAVLERTREIGVLRAVGARHGAILFLVQAEGLVIGLLSWAAAIPLSIPLSLGLGKAFGRIMLPVRVVTVWPEPGGVLRWLLVVVVVSLAACAWPALRAMRVPAARALAYE